MAVNKFISDWSRTNASNATVDDVNWAENQAPSTVNDSARAGMAHIAEWRDAIHSGQVYALTDNSSATNAWAMTSTYPMRSFSAGTTVTVPTAGQIFIFLAPTSPTGALTLAVNGGTAKNAFLNGAALSAAGQISSGDPLIGFYDGTEWQLIPFIPRAFGSPIQFPNGSNAAPSITFISDADTGFYRIGANDIGITVGGTKVVDINSSGVSFVTAFGAADGTVSAPGVSFSADGDSGMYRIGTNNIGLAVNGTKILDINTSGYSFTGQLGAPNGTAGAPSISFSSDGDTGLYRIGANNIGAAVNGAKVLDINTSGMSVTGDMTTSGVFTEGATALTAKYVQIATSVTAGTNPTYPVGEYAFLQYQGATTPIDAGTQVSSTGGNFKTTNAAGQAGQTIADGQTWECRGTCNTSSAPHRSTVWKRMA